MPSGFDARGLFFLRGPTLRVSPRETRTLSLDSSHEEGAALVSVINGAVAVEDRVDVWAEARRMVEPPTFVSRD